MRRALAIVVGAAALLAVAWSSRVRGEAYDDPWSPATEQAAEAAVAKLGAARGLALVPATRTVAGSELTVSGLALGTGSAALGVQGKVQDLATALRDLGADESDLEVRIELPADVLFDVDKSDIRADAAQALKQLATVIRSFSGPVRLIGHTDSDGSDAHNLALSQRRAESVRAWLVGREGIPAARLATSGEGESRPAAANDSAANKQRNRRVEVIVRKR